MHEDLDELPDELVDAIAKRTRSAGQRILAAIRKGHDLGLTENADGTRRLERLAQDLPFGDLNL